MAKPFCENCGQPLRETDYFCLNCGQAVKRGQDQSNGGGHGGASSISNGSVQVVEKEKLGFCPECGSKVRKTWFFCMSCGGTLNFGRGKGGVPQPTPDTSDNSVPSGIPSTQQLISKEPEYDTVVPGIHTVRVDDFGGRLTPPEPFDGMEWDQTDAGFPADDTPTTIYNDDDDNDDLDAPTMVYQDEAPKPKYVLTSASSGESYELSLPAKIGRGSAASVRISGNRFIGRVHAQVYERDGVVLVEDNGSANHTYLNGDELTPGLPVPLKDGDILGLAKEEFRVSVE